MPSIALVAAGSTAGADGWPLAVTATNVSPMANAVCNVELRFIWDSFVPVC